MMKLCASYSKKGQVKMQQMAFVLVAIIIFFALVALIYLSIALGGFEKTAGELKNKEAKELVKKLAGSAELSIEGCSNCVDFDKAIILKERDSYKGFWNLGYFAIEITYPESPATECNKANYDECNKITLIDNAEMGNVNSAFVSVCRIENSKGAYRKCGIGKIYASGEQIIS